MGEMGILKVILDIPIPIDKLYKKVGKNIFSLPNRRWGGGEGSELRGHTLRIILLQPLPNQCGCYISYIIKPATLNIIL